MSVSDLITLRQQQDEKTEAITVRLTSSLLGTIDDLAASLDVTRQLLVTEIIKDGVEAALALFDKTQNKPENEGQDELTGTKFFILNTNKRHDLDTHVDMVENGNAAAFCDPWKFQINRIKPKDVVFLYENGVGIVGVGIASGKVEKLEYDGISEDEYRQKLNNYKKVTPINARDIKKIIGSNLVFLRTLFTIPSEFGVKIQEHLEPI
jgi:predicted DNA binding CopG/RHH family protein